MLEELYDKTVILLTIATAFCALTIYPVIGPLVTTGYLIWAYSFFLTPILDRAFDNKPVKLLYTLSFTGAGFTAVLTPILGGVLVLDAIITQYTGISYSVTAIKIGFYTGLLLTLYGVIKSYYIHVREEIIDLNLDTELHLVHVSDLHIGASVGRKRMETIVEKIRDIDPDYTVITGDTLDGSGWPVAANLAPLRRLNSVYASMGNHDYYFGDDSEAYLEENGVTVLRNESTNNDDIFITGVDDIEYPDQVPSKHILDEDVPSDVPSILLYHRPDEDDAFKSSDYDVMLSGHTHNGQIYSNRFLLYLFYTHLYGLYIFEDNKYLNVTSGAGTGGPPIRLGTTSEITHLKLK